MGIDSKAAFTNAAAFLHNVFSIAGQILPPQQWSLIFHEDYQCCHQLIVKSYCCVSFLPYPEPLFHMIRSLIDLMHIRVPTRSAICSDTKTGDKGPKVNSNSIYESLFKFHSLNHHLRVICINIVFYIFLLVCTLESHSRFLSLASENSEIQYGYIWITK
jgi:hypothetical protein